MTGEKDIEYKKKDLSGTRNQCRLLPSWRLSVTLVCTLGTGVAMFGRSQTSFAVLCMVRDPTSADLTSANLTSADLTSANLTSVNLTNSRDSSKNGNRSRQASTHGEFTWDKTFQGWLLSAFFYGYVLALVPGGWVADRYPAHRVAIASALLQAVAVALIPELTRLHPYSILVLRMLQGVFAAALYPCLNVILLNWSTAGEFALLFAMAISGANVGGAGAFTLTSRLCQADVLGGWPLVYYVSALAFVAWAVVTRLVVTELPEQHRFISQAERNCLTSQSHAHTSTSEPIKPISIWRLTTNLQIWIIALSYFGTSWFFASLNITLPTFMKEGFNFDVNENGLVSALPSLLMGVCIIVGGKTFKYMHIHKGVSKTSTRKILSLIGLLVPAACMIGMIQLPASQRYLAVLLITLAQGISSFVISSGPVSAAADIAPHYIGLIWGVASSFGNTTGFLVPLIATAMTPNGTLGEWCRFFGIAIVQLVALSVLIGCCWRSELQPLSQQERQSKPHRSRGHADTVATLDEIC